MGGGVGGWGVGVGSSKKFGALGEKNQNVVEICVKFEKLPSGATLAFFSIREIDVSARCKISDKSPWKKSHV